MSSKDVHFSHTVENDLIIEDSLEGETLLGIGRLSLVEGSKRLPSKKCLEQYCSKNTLKFSKQKDTIKTTECKVKSNSETVDQNRTGNIKTNLCGSGSSEQNDICDKRENSNSSLKKTETNPRVEVTQDHILLNSPVHTSDTNEVINLQQKYQEKQNNYVRNYKLSMLDNDEKTDTAAISNQDTVKHVSCTLSKKEAIERGEILLNSTTNSAISFEISLKALKQKSKLKRRETEKQEQTQSSQKVKSSTVPNQLNPAETFEPEISDCVKQCQSENQQKPIVFAKHRKSSLIDLKTATSVKKLLFGSASESFPSSWANQGFTFQQRSNVKFGFVQKGDGPCGLMSAVQASLLKQLLFSDSNIKPSMSKLNLQGIKRSESLANALAEIVWKAKYSSGSDAVFCLPGDKPYFHESDDSEYKNDGITEKLILYFFEKREDLYDFIHQHICTFENEDGPGIIIFLYSVILSHSIERVISDMDVPTNTLLTEHGHCTQEMVNLLLTGVATSNVFNDFLESGSEANKIIRKGVQGRSDCGLLSLDEHFKSCKVGTYMKTPRYPIWVVHTRDHFSVLFSLKKELLGDWKAERLFDLFYYDGMTKQNQLIKLTVHTTCRGYEAPLTDDEVSPIEHCIRTKWSGAYVDWNGTNPVLENSS